MKDQNSNAPIKTGYELVPYDEARGLGAWVGAAYSSQRSGVSDIYYIWGPGRLLASRLLGFSGIAMILSIVMSVTTLNFAFYTLALIFGRGTEGF